MLIKTPIRIEQGEADTTVFKTFTDQLVTGYTGGRAEGDLHDLPGR